MLKTCERQDRQDGQERKASVVIMVVHHATFAPEGARRREF
jgi:hypothetical protein